MIAADRPRPLEVLGLTLSHRSPADMQAVTICRWKDGAWQEVRRHYDPPDEPPGPGAAAVNPARGWARIEYCFDEEPWVSYQVERARYLVRWGVTDPRCLRYGAAPVGSEPHPLWVQWAESQEQSGAIYDRERQEVFTP